METSDARPYNYSVFTFVADETRGTAVPVGVALWGSSPDAVRLRLAGPTEPIKGLRSDAFPYIQLVGSQLNQWIRSGHLPYAAALVSPNTEQWWTHLNQLLMHRIRVSPPHAVDCRNPDEDVELLFEALVKPERNEKEKIENIDRELSRSLGPLSRKLHKGSVPGFHGRSVPVKRFVEDQRTLFILEGVNLAAASAEEDADALVSRLQRVRETNGSLKGKRVIAVVGYLASPHGLNGEAALVDWINYKGDAQTFDLTRQREVFSATVEAHVEQLDLGDRPKGLFV